MIQQNPTDPLTLTSFYTTTYEPLLAARLAASTIAGYRKTIRQLEQFAGGELPIADVTELLVTRFASSLRKEGRTEHYIRVQIATITRVVREWAPGALPNIYLADKRPRELPPAEPGSLREFCELSYIPQYLFDRTHDSVRNTRKALWTLTEHYGRDVALAELTDKLAADHLAWLMAKGMSRATVNRIRAEWFAVWRAAHREGAVNAEPHIKKVRQPQRAPDAWSVEQFAAILQAASSFQPQKSYGKVPCNLWWPAMLLTAWYTGLRRAALFSMKRSDVDLASGWIHVPAEHMKSRRAARLRLGPDAVQAIRHIWSPPRALLFPCVHSPNTMNEHFDQVLIAAGVAPSVHRGHNKWHKIRRTCATHAAAAAGVGAASALLGHSNHSVTIKHYLDVRFCQDQDATRFLPSLAELHRIDAERQCGPPRN